MARYIDVDFFKELITYCHEHTPDGSEVHYVYGVVLKELDKIPIADVVEVRHGAWGEDDIAYVCTLCGESLVIEQGTADMNYCPHCGAKMDGGTE